MNVVTLIGYRGSGKSTVAPLLARRLGWDWIDSDVEIERRAGRTIREIFADLGEAGFRRQEHDVLQELLAREQLVIAAGGGAILNDATRARMKSSGPVVWLRASMETLAARIAGDATTADRRPNLAGGGPAEITAMLAVRTPLYQETASLVVDVDARPPALLVDEIRQALDAAEEPRR